MTRQRGLLPDPSGLFGLILFLTLCALSGSQALRDGDTLWHIRVGQLILEQGSLLTTDIFSHTAYGQDWIAHEWLAEVGMALVYDLGGMAGLSIAAFSIIGLSFTLLFRAARELAGDRAALLAIAIAAPLAYTHLLVRPHLFTWLFGSLTLFLLLRSDRWLWLLPFVTALWSNLHGGVLIGLLLQGVFLCGGLLDRWPGRSRERWQQWWSVARRPAFVLLLSLLTLGCNPFGYHLLWFPLQVSSAVFAAEINEWKAPNLQTFWYARAWLLIVMVLAAWQGLKARWCWRLLVPLLIYMALGHIRHVSIAAMFIAPWTAQAFQAIGLQLRPPRPRREAAREVAVSAWSGPLLIIVAGIILLGICSKAPTWWQTFAAGRYKLPELYTEAVITHLEQGLPPGNLLNEYALGDYLIYAMAEPPKVFIDGRADMYGERIFADYVTLAHVGPDTDRLLQRYAIDWVLFPREHLLVRYLLLQPAWQLSYRDDQVCILVRKPEGTPPLQAGNRP